MQTKRTWKWTITVVEERQYVIEVDVYAKPAVRP
jgi:hypothetical protein